MEDLGVDGRIIFKVDLKEVGLGMHWIDLIHFRDR